MSLTTNTRRIYADTNYKLPVFKIEAAEIELPNKSKQIAKSVRISNLNYTTDFFNISYNNNVIRWLRKLEDSFTPSGWIVTGKRGTSGNLEFYINGELWTDGTPLPKSTEISSLTTGAELNTYLVNPINNTSRSNYYALDQLYVDPNSYASTIDLVRSINTKFENSISDLVNIDAIEQSMMKMTYEELTKYFETTFGSEHDKEGGTFYVLDSVQIEGETLEDYKYLNFTEYVRRLEIAKSELQKKKNKARMNEMAERDDEDGEVGLDDSMILNNVGDDSKVTNAGGLNGMDVNDSKFTNGIESMYPNDVQKYADDSTFDPIDTSATSQNLAEIIPTTSTSQPNVPKANDAEPTAEEEQSPEEQAPEAEEKPQFDIDSTYSPVSIETLQNYVSIINPYTSSLISVILNKEATGGANFFTQQDIVDQGTITLRTSFECIPVSFSNNVISTVDNFTTIYHNYDMFATYDTVIPTKILSTTFSESEPIETVLNNINIGPINNVNYISNYLTSIAKVDSFYYNFSSNSDLWHAFGTDYFTILNDDVVKFANNVNDGLPIYVIYGQYYSEMLYKGPIYANVNYVTQDGDLDVRIARGTDISGFPTSVLNEFITKTHYGRYHVDLSLPRKLNINITQNDDVERIVNNMYSISPFIDYSLVYTNQPVYTGINQIIDINKSVSFSNNDVLYLYVTSDTHVYPISNLNAYIDVEYYN